jgi:hypothetical protein
MTYAAHHRDFGSGSEAAATRDAVAAKTGVLPRIFDALLGSSHNQADREIAAFVARRGGRITDDLEREMTHRLLTSNWSDRG